MEVFKESISGIVVCLFEFIAGILLLINPIGFTSGIIVVAGIVMLIMGLISIVKYFRLPAKEGNVSQSLVKGLIAVVAGAFCVFKSHWFIATFPVLTIIYGVVILVTGLGKVQQTVDMLRQKNKKWFLAAINAVISIVCAIVVLKSPFTSTAVLWVFTGVSLIVEAVFDVITMILGGKDEVAV